MGSDRRFRAPRAAAFAALAAGMLAAACGHATDGEDAAAGTDGGDATDFIRFRDDDPDKQRLETAIVDYADDEGRRVALVGAVHVADAAYYDELNQLFPRFDRVLYEVVAPKGTVPTPGRGEASEVGLVQLVMKDLLRLEFQLDRIDYTAANFVHADLAPSELLARMEERGESVFSIILHLVLAQMKGQGEGDLEQAAAQQVAMMMSFFSPDRARALKLAVGRQFADLEKTFVGLEEARADGRGSLLIGERNAAVIEELERQLDAGARRIAIFYGAGHMPDLERRLAALGFAPTSHAWLTAWDLR